MNWVIPKWKVEINHGPSAFLNSFAQLIVRLNRAPQGALPSEVQYAEALKVSTV
jgi:hypothetical protein